MSWGDGGGKRARPRLEFSLWLICSYFGLGGDAILAEAFDLGLADVGDAAEVVFLFENLFGNSAPAAVVFERLSEIELFGANRRIRCSGQARSFMPHFSELINPIY